MAPQRPRNQRNTQMADQIGAVRRNIQVKRPSSLFAHPSVNSWKADGDDHINIWEFGRTELGQLLSVNFSLPFKHPVLGKFKSIRGLWVYVSTKEQNDVLRNMDSRHIRDYVREVEQIKINNFHAIIVDSCYQRIKQLKILSAAVMESELPFDCYSSNSQGLRTRAPFMSWFVAGMEEIRSALKENREPNLEFLMSNPEQPLYKEIAPWFYEERNKPTKPRSENSLLSAIIADSKSQFPKSSKDKTVKSANDEIPVERSVDEGQDLLPEISSELVPQTSTVDPISGHEEGSEEKDSASIDRSVPASLLGVGH